MDICYSKFVTLYCIVQGGGDVPRASDTKEILRENLIDAGCTPEVVQECMTLAQQQESAALLRVLSRHRKSLLDTVHQNEKRIDCLDYLVYQLKKQSS